MVQSQLVWLQLLEADLAKARLYLEMGLLHRICMVEAVKVVKTVDRRNLLLVVEESIMLTEALLLVQIRVMKGFHMVPLRILESQLSLELVLVGMAVAGKAPLLLVPHQTEGQAKHRQEGESLLVVRLVRDTITKSLTVLLILLRYQVVILLPIQHLLLLLAMDTVHQQQILSPHDLQYLLHQATITLSPKDLSTLFVHDHQDPDQEHRVSSLSENLPGHLLDLHLLTKLLVQQLVDQLPLTKLLLLPLQPHLLLGIHILNQLILSPLVVPSKYQIPHQ